MPERQTRCRECDVLVELDGQEDRRSEKEFVGRKLEARKEILALEDGQEQEGRVGH